MARCNRVEGVPSPRAQARGRRSPAAVRCRLLFCLAVHLLLLLPPLRAQVPDTTQAAGEDTLQTVPDTLARQAGLQPPVGFAPPEPGETVVDVLPVLLPVLEAPGILAHLPGSFVYRFDEPGWPDGWSLYGLPPERTALLLGGLPFDDLVTGRPRFDLLPLELLEPLRTGGTRYGAPVAVSAHVRPYSTPQPLTELRYRGGGSGLQAIAALHVQQRRRPLFGREGVLNVLGAYMGRASAGDFPTDAGWGTRLRRERRLLARLRYAQPGWTLELRNLHNRRQLGAHGGVDTTGLRDFDLIYERLGATVRNPAAWRQTIRNDLSLEARTRLLPRTAGPATVTLYWTAQTFRYANVPDTLTVRADRYGFRARQRLQLGRWSPSLYLDGWHTRLGPSNALPDAGTPARSQLHAAVQDTLRLLGTEAALEGGFHAGRGPAYLSAAARLSRTLGALQLFAEGTRAGQPISFVEQYGFGPYLQPLEASSGGRVTQGRLGFRLTLGSWEALLFGFASQATDAADLYSTGQTDTVAVRQSTAPVRRAGAAGDVGWRSRAERGLYATAQATFLRLLNADASPEHARLSASLPQFFGQGRLGARLLLFTGDLDLDLYLQGRFWTALRSRTLHPPTGLLVLPLPDARTFGPSGTLDVFAEAGVRTATLFFGFENILSGTSLMAGTLIVPVYPLPERRFRFGVYWPIEG